MDIAYNITNCSHFTQGNSPQSVNTDNKTNYYNADFLPPVREEHRPGHRNCFPGTNAGLVSAKRVFWRCNQEQIKGGVLHNGRQKHNEKVDFVAQSSQVCFQLTAGIKFKDGD